MKQSRQFQTIDLHRMFKAGEIEKDYQGYFMLEVSDNSYGDKLYFEESYVYMENRIRRLFEDANKIYHQLKTGPKQSQQRWCLELLKTDYQLMLLFSLYKGEEFRPFMSPPQISSWLTEQLSLNIYCEILQGKEKTPLFSYQLVKGFLGTNRVCEQLGHNEARNESSNRNGLLQVLPYGMKKRE
ncbi:hypothetical protein JOC78_002391 [Bacillus ectoiniformans]|nr:hypothetical protein [Bacillus ectoiniformans]